MLMKSAQQKWNETNPEKVKEYDRKRRNKYKQITIRLDKEADRELIEQLESLETSITDFGKSALKEKLAAMKSA